MKQQELPVMEAFYTLQGEGFYSGKPAYFIRLAGCDVGCFWCDVKESWNADAHPKMSINEIIQKLNTEINSINDKPIIVITGGEPLMHDLNELTETLQQKGFQTNIETSGTHALSGKWDWICVSPKKFKFALPEILPLAHELKVIITNKTDFEWAENYAAHVNKNCKLYLQPEWDRRNEMSPLIVNYIKMNPKWQMSLQTHKYLNIP